MYGECPSANSSLDYLLAKGMWLFLGLFVDRLKLRCYGCAVFRPTTLGPRFPDTTKYAEEVVQCGDGLHTFF